MIGFVISKPRGVCIAALLMLSRAGAFAQDDVAVIPAEATPATSQEGNPTAVTPPQEAEPDEVRRNAFMFMPSERVICVDDSNPNPLCKFPCGYVVRGRFYHVKGTTVVGGVQIEGLPVTGFLHPLMFGLTDGSKQEADVGWKPHRFRRFEGRSSEDEIGDSVQDELLTQ